MSEPPKQDRDQDQATRQTRIQDAIRDFMRNTLPALQAKHARSDVREQTLFSPSRAGAEE
jgi:hypothetical protein